MATTPLDIDINMEDIGPQWPDTSENSVSPKSFSAERISSYDGTDNSMNLDTPICNPKRGPTPGSHGRKRKTSEELSTHPRSVKRRNREAAMTQVEKKIDNAKKADRAAIGYRICLLKDMDAYKCVTGDEQARMEDDVRHDILRKRLVYFLGPHSF